MAQWPLALTGSYWLQLSIIVGAIAVAIRMRPPLARVGALFAVLWIVLLVVWISANLGIMAAFPLSPIYFFLMMYPFWAFFSLYAGVSLIEITTSRFVPQARSADPRLVCTALCVAAVALIPLFHADVSRVFKWSGVQIPRRDADYASAAARHRAASRSGLPRIGRHSPRFSGKSVAASVARQCRAPAAAQEFERFLQRLAIDTGNSHDLLDLWWRRYPDLVGVWPGTLQAPHILHLERAQRAGGRARSQLRTPAPGQYRHLEGNGRPTSSSRTSSYGPTARA